MMNANVELYTDGACCDNPGQGGWAFLLIDPASQTEIECYGAELMQTTNQRMELVAAIKGLSRIKHRSHVELFADSEYLGKGLTEWLPKWKANRWRSGKRGKGKPVANADLWRELDELARFHTVGYRKVTAHTGQFHNERVDRLAESAAANAAQTMKAIAGMSRQSDSNRRPADYESAALPA